MSLVHRPTSGPEAETPVPRVKICGITQPEDAAFATDAGADYLGVILSPGYSRSLTIDQAEAVTAAMGSKRVGVMVDPEPVWAIDTALRLRLDVVQLHGSESPEVAERIRGGGTWSVWKVFPLLDRHDLDAVEAFADAVDGVHVDARRRDLRPGGGTGRTFRWDGVSEEVRRRAPGLLFIAAGGLDPANVCQAVHSLDPDVVDASSGVESEPGKKDARRVSHFIQAVHRCTEVQGGAS